MHFITVLTLSLLTVVQAQQPPSIQLPWGTYVAQAINDASDVPIWHIPNVRFGKDTSLTRFQAPQSPDPIADPTKVQDQTYGPACIQIAQPSHTCSSTAKPGLGAPIPGAPANTDSEDCLFLDIYFPQSVDIASPTTPVVVWIYGGAYVYGSKGPVGDIPLYSGQGLIEAANILANSANVIFVAGNYRLGAFGWLAGPTMQSLGQPNAGIYDQSAVFSWVQQYIHLVGGDNTSISAWGESAGASSILHHLVQQDNQPLPFQSALLQSPAFEWQWDNSANGTLEGVFNQFAEAVGCSGTSPTAQFDCIQTAPVSNLTTANQNLVASYHTRGLFPFGPAVDNISFPLLPPVALAEGKFKSIKSLIVSHVFNESGTFTPKNVSYNTFVSDFLPETQDAEVVNNTINFYANITDELTRLQDTIRDVSFTCNTRYLYNAYSKQANVWMMQYSVGSAILPKTLDLARHASDLLSAFWYQGWDIDSVLKNMFCIASPGIRQTLENLVTSFAPTYQQYVSSFAASGNPNSPGVSPVWKTASDNGESVTNVLDFGFTQRNDYIDDKNTWTYCGFWLEQAKTLQANVQSRILRNDQILRVQNPDRLEL